jgi:hypothetical protein
MSYPKGAWVAPVSLEKFNPQNRLQTYRSPCRGLAIRVLFSPFATKLYMLPGRWLDHLDNDDMYNLIHNVDCNLILIFPDLCSQAVVIGVQRIMATINPLYVNGCIAIRTQNRTRVPIKCPWNKLVNAPRPDSQ